LKRISQNRALFEANPNEMITVTVEASNAPYQATFSSLKSGSQWTVLQSPTPTQPIEKRQFMMPAIFPELFAIVYVFPPNGQIAPNAKYRITFAGAGYTSDGPNDVIPPVSGDMDDLPYEFRLTGAAVSDSVSAPQPTAQNAVAQPAAAVPTKKPESRNR
jgi:hypothetical protein